MKDIFPLNLAQKHLMAHNIHVELLTAVLGQHHHLAATVLSTTVVTRG